MSTCATCIRICGRVMALGVFALALSACSRTVKWEEEVPLNTGETIWIQREMKWAMLGGLGNPFDIALRPTRDQTIRFTYRGKTYTYSGRANILWLAIAPYQKPVLVAPAADYGWYSANNYYCVVPYYVQFVPDDQGEQWRWPEAIEEWLYGLPANVMASIPRLNEERKQRYTHAQRNERDSTYRSEFPSGGLIDRTYKAGSCITRVPGSSENHLDWRNK